MKNRNKKGPGRTIAQSPLPKQFPELNEIKAGQYDRDSLNVENTFEGERSPYWDWAEASGHNEEGEYSELPRANPDWNSESDDYDERRVKQQAMLEAVYKVLSPREKQIFKLILATLTEDEMAAQLNISRSRVSQCKKRIQNKFKSYGVSE